MFTRFTRGQRAVYAPIDPTRARFRATCSSDSCSRCFQRGTEVAPSRGSARGTPPALDRPRARTFGRAPHARETRLTPHVPPIDHDDDGFIPQLLPRRPRPRARPVRPVSNSPFRALCTVRGRGVSFFLGAREAPRPPAPPRAHRSDRDSPLTRTFPIPPPSAAAPWAESTASSRTTTGRECPSAPSAKFPVSATFLPCRGFLTEIPFTDPSSLCHPSASMRTRTSRPPSPRLATSTARTCGARSTPTTPASPWLASSAGSTSSRRTSRTSNPAACPFPTTRTRTAF